MARKPRLSLYLLATAQRDFLGNGLARFPALNEGPATERAGPNQDGGATVWVHVGASTSQRAAAALVRRLIAEHSDLRLICTSDEGAGRDLPGVHTAVRPSEASGQIREFLSKWSPKAALWLGEPVWPALANALHRAAIPAVLADVGVGRSGPFGTGPEHVVDLFQHVLARSVTDAEILRRSSRRPVRVEAAAPLREGPAPPRCNARDLEALTGENAGRPVWLAMGVLPEELDAVLAAHARAARLSHRLLLVLCPAEPERAGDLETRLRGEGWRVECRSRRDTPSATAQIFLADVEEEEALWFRFAPTSFLGTSLVPGRGGIDPAAPAALGSAILHGPFVGFHEETYHRLSAAGAALSVRSGDDLGLAVADLQSPERAAQMANAAWRVASDGAEITDRILTLLSEILDKAE